MLLLRKFNRQSTVIRLNQFGNPRITSMSGMELPRGSIYHFPPQDVSVVGPQQSSSIISKSEKTTAINFHTKLEAPDIKGRPREIQTPLNSEVVKYLRNNKRIRRLREPLLIERDPRVLLIENYALLPRRYVYSKTEFSQYEQWHNEFSTVIQGMANAAMQFPERQNYIEFTMSSSVPAIAKFRQAENRRDINTVRPFMEDKLSLFLLELWTWLGNKRHNSILTILQPEVLSRINFIITYNGKFFNLNLGELNFWRKEGKIGKVDPLQMQKRLWASCYALATKAAEVTEEGEVEEVKEVAADPEVVVQPEVPESVEDIDKDETDKEIARFEDEVEIDEEEGIEAVKAEDINPSAPVNIEKALTAEEGIEKECRLYIESGQMTTKRYEFLKNAAEAYKTIPNPFGEGMIGDNLEVTKEDIVVKKEVLFDDVTVVDKSMTESSLVNYDKQYINTVLPKDLLGSVMGLQNAGIAVTNYEIEPVIDAANRLMLHKIKVVPVDGEPSTITFTTPILDERGYWTANDVTYTMRKQRVDVPIRKTSPNTVALTSFYGKNFVRRAEGKSKNYSAWLREQITVRGRDIKDESITGLQFSSVFNNEEKLPRDYSTVAMSLSGFNALGYHFNFDYSKVEDMFGVEQVKELKTEKLTPLAKSKSDILVMDNYNAIYRKDKDGMTQLGRLQDILDLTQRKVPYEYAELSLMGKAIPLAIIFAYYIGLEECLVLFGVNYRIAERNARIAAEEADLIIPCRDGKYVIQFGNPEQEMLFNGWRPYLQVTKLYTTRDLNTSDVYLPLIEKDKLTLRYLNELSLMNDMFVDPITLRILQKMKEPETFMGLLRRSNELLTTDWHPDEMSAKYQHMFTNHRIPGAVYTSMVRSVRQFRNKNTSRRKLELPPNEVWREISSDGSVMTASDANAVHSVKENSVVTLAGTYGRSKRSMVKHTRKFDKDSLGWISGDTVDSGDVAITSYMVADPAVIDVDGGLADYERESMDMSKYLSLPVMLAPGSMYDDGKRKNFVGIQHGSGTSGKGYVVTPYRTGAEKALAHSTRDTQAQIAEDAGKVIDVTDSAITVKYESGVEKSYPLGRFFGRHEGAVFPRDTVPNFKKGMKFEKNSVLTYNDKFFEPDWYNPSQVNWKAGIMANVAMIEGNDTFEDSSAISEKVSKLLATETTKVKNITVSFDQAVRNLVKVGAEVDDDSILCVIEDALTANTSLFKEESLATLKNISSQMPQAKVRGHIDNIEIFYNGDMEDMSESVLKIAQMGDRQRKKLAAASPIAIAETGKVDSSLRIDGIPVELDTLVIRIYITHESEAIGGDKAVFANQMKSTFRRVLTGENVADNGTELDAIFGRLSIDNRIVLSVYRIGTSNKFSELLSNRLMAISKGEL